ncbi:MAG: TIGR00282 family metallophosphoesterase [Candidatus Sumerlaeaceae bacterium]|nr:TIGR00282 family metallophosphoesterase [Candidatus Sumerlaeaceae bacterium]
MRILIVGDAVGRPGRDALKHVLPDLRKERDIHFIIANGENSAAGKGITRSTADDMLKATVDAITTGNHVWDNKDIFNFIKDEPRVIRPANFPPDPVVPGKGSAIFSIPNTPFRVGVVNVMGRVMMAPIDCPFRAVRGIVDELRKETPIIFVDFHAEATSEKVAMGWYLDGDVSCVFGTHTHVPTADERLLPKGTAYITDIGMTGAFDSVIGMKLESVMDRFLYNLPTRGEVAEKNVKLSGALVTVDPTTGKARGIERVLLQA